MCDPTTYPLFLPYETEGLCKNSALSGVTCLQYDRYLMYERNYTKNHMFKGQNLQMCFSNLELMYVTLQSKCAV